MARVLAIERVVLDTPVVVYNFTVAGVHTYFVLEVGVLVHNCGALSRRLAAGRGPLIGATGYNYPNVQLMDLRYIDEQYGAFLPGRNVRYLKTEIQRGPFEVFVRGDRLVDSTGNLIDTTGNYRKRGIFVMDPKGRIFWSNKHRIGDFHHSSFLAGQPVAAAGEISVRRGVLLEVTAHSGHYKPPKSLNQQLLDELHLRGLSNAPTIPLLP